MRLYLFSLFLFTAVATKSTFRIICLGKGGGPYQHDLLSFLIGVSPSPHSLPSAFGVFDAGTFYTGIKEAVSRNAFDGLTIPYNVTLDPVGYISNYLVTDFFITHHHFDHIAGLVIDSPSVDKAGPKGVHGLESTIANLTQHVFNWQVWPNMGNAGVPPYLNILSYHILPQNTTVDFPKLNIAVAAFPLDHRGITSTAFLIKSKLDDTYLLFVGDLAPDSVMNSTLNFLLWQQVAPLVRDGSLRGIFIETSYPDPKPDNLLFGHLSVAKLFEELNVLASLVNDTQAMKELTVIITHIKPLIDGVNARDLIVGQVRTGNKLGIRFVFPLVGDSIAL